MTGWEDHDACVEAWLARSDGLGTAQRCQFFEQALSVLWHRAHRTLADVTLMAIVERVLYNAAERVPLFGVLRVETNGFLCDGLRERSRTADPALLAEGMRFVLTEYLTVLGSLTADVLTPALHAELANMTLSAGDGKQQNDGKSARAEGQRDS